MLKPTETGKSEIKRTALRQLDFYGEIGCPVPGSLKESPCYGAGENCKFIFPEITCCPCGYYSTKFKDRKKAKEYVKQKFWEAIE